MSALHLFASNYQSVYNRRGEFINMQTHFAGKKLGLLFSASWCKPCREMTPQIMKYYEQNNGGKDFDIVFVSGDNDEMSFQRYYATMPWLALNFNESQINQYLHAMFKVTKMPRLVILDGDSGMVLVNDALNLEKKDLMKMQKK